MEDEYNEYFYNHKCGVCGVISKEKVRILKDKQSLEPRITEDFCSNGHRIIIPKGNYKPIGKELVLLNGN